MHDPATGHLVEVPVPINSVHTKLQNFMGATTGVYMIAP
jgi:hypothetical protein